MTKKKRKSKSLLALIMAGVIMLSQQSLPVQAANFTDVPSGAWYEYAVNSLADRGIISGIGDNKFAPGRALSRAETVTILAKMALSSTDIEQYKNFSRFNDVPKDKWYTPFINWASEAGVVSGDGNGRFRPDGAIARQELAVILQNFSEKMGYKLPANVEEKNFADGGNISGWASRAVKNCQRAGVFKGDEKNRFNPQNHTSRAEASASIYNYLEVADNSAYKFIRKRIAGVYVTGVTFDATQYEGGIAMANDRVNGGENMSSMISRTGARFAVNAAYFDMKNYNPNGTIIDNGKVITLQDSYAPYKTSFVLNSSGSPSIQNFRTNQKVSLVRDGYEISAVDYVGANRAPSTSADATRILYDRFWGSSVGIYVRDAIAVDGSGQIVEKVSQSGDIGIPQGGQVLYQRTRREYEGDFFDSARTGDSIFVGNIYEGSSVNDIDLSIASGPRIVKDGAVYGNAGTYRQEGLGASDIVSGTAKRVAIGVNGNTVTIITVPSCNMAKLSEIMQGAGCSDAMNLDGGGSTGLYVDGTYLATPGRKLNNMIYFK